MIFGYGYRNHLNFANTLYSEKEKIYCSFEEWLSLYSADSNNWYIKKDKVCGFFAYNAISYIPYYEYFTTTNRYCASKKFIFFKKRIDYIRFYNCWKHVLRKRANKQNLSNLLELTEIISEKNKKKLEEINSKNEELLKNIKEKISLTI